MTARSAVSAELDALLTVLREHNRHPIAGMVSFHTEQGETRITVDLEDEDDQPEPQRKH